MPKVSVIVPVFGVEKFIERCVRSLFAQTMEDVEFIFVNDGTPDSSMTILDSIIHEYPDRHVQIVTHEKNRGLPEARKTGILVASGEYILHCDSDDWLEPECCEVLYGVASMEHADMVVFKNWINDSNACYEDNSYDDTLFADKEQALSAAISLKSSPYVWNKFVSKRLYDYPILFPKNNLAEDWVLSVQYAYYSEKTVCIEERLYHYFRNENSIMGGTSKEACFKRCADEFANVSLICDWLDGKDLLNMHKWEIVKRKTISKNQLLPVINNSSAIKLWRKTFSEINYLVLLSPEFDIAYKMRHLLLVTGFYRPFKRCLLFLRERCQVF